MYKGVHGPNVMGNAWSEEHYRWLREGGFNGVKAFHYYDINVYKRCLQIDPNMFFVVRLYYHGKPPAPQQAADAVSGRLEELLRNNIEFITELHNEPDHVGHVEGWGKEDHHAQDFSLWYISTFEILKQRFPQVPIGFPALAFNTEPVNFDPNTAKPGHWNWLYYCRDAINMSDWLAMHTYWQRDNMLNPRFGLSFLHWHKAFPRHQIHITEFGNSSCQPPINNRLPESAMAEEYKSYYHLLSQYPNFMRGAYYFMLGGTPDWDGFYLRDANRLLRDTPLVSLPSISQPFAGDFRVTQGFGVNPQTYARFGYAGHNGIDWGLPSGTPLLACDDGTVTVASRDPSGSGGYGMNVRIRHGWGESLCAHMSRVDVARGQRVKRGQPIGLSGSTGFSTGPHLHFGVKVNNAQDPEFKDWINPQLLGLEIQDIVVPVIPEYRVEYQRYGLVQELPPSAVVQTEFTVRNAGSKTWRKAGTNKVRLGYHWYDGVGREVNNVQDLRTELPNDVSQGQVVTLRDVKCAAPPQAGQYQLRWDMVEEGVTWFVNRGAKTLDMNVRIVAPESDIGSPIETYLADNPQIAQLLGAQISGGFTAADGNRLEFFEDGALIVNAAQQVMLGPVGGWIRDVYQAQGRPQFQDAPPRNTPDNRFFPDTGHNLFGVFARGWREIFGPPVTEEFHMVIDGRGMTFQLYHFALCTHNPDTDRVERVRGVLGKMFLSQIEGGPGLELIGRLL